MREQFLADKPPEGIFRVGECMRLSQEPLRGLVDAAYIFGRAEGDWEATEGDPGLLKIATEYYQKGKVPKVSISGLGTGHGYPGAEVWKKELQDLGVETSDIVPSSGKGWHTRKEADDLVKLAREQGWQKVLLFAYPHQALRVMLSVVAAMKEAGYEFTVRMVCPEPNWEKEVRGSQGAKLLPRKEHILEEWERIDKYQRPLDRGSVGEALKSLLKGGFSLQRSLRMVSSAYDMLVGKTMLVSFQELYDYLLRTKEA